MVKAEVERQVKRMTQVQRFQVGKERVQVGIEAFFGSE
jgi:hypothetical protein